LVPHPHHQQLYTRTIIISSKGTLKGAVVYLIIIKGTFTKKREKVWNFERP
jgi:hypothetical protein